MEIVSWNIQSGRGADGVVDLKRIASAVQAMGDHDVVCFQEVARYIPEVDRGAGADQVKLLAEAFPRHEAIFGAPVDRAGDMTGRRRQFGNLVLSRLPVVQAFRHQLPLPPDPGARHMPRQALEVVVSTKVGGLRVVTTHLEYYSTVHREAQVERLRALHAEVWEGLQDAPPKPDDGPFAPMPRPASAVLCGDFNFVPDEPPYSRLVAGLEAGAPAFRDAWRARRPDRPHDPTCGVFDREQWKEGPHCRDFFFVTEDLADRLSVIEVNLETNASDHQPVRLVLNLDD